MQAGRLDRRITIQRKTVTLSPSGVPIETWADVGVRRRSAQLLPVRGDERFGGDQLVAMQQVEFRIRYSSEVADLSPLDRIIYPALDDGSPVADPEEARIYDVLAVSEIGRRVGLKIIAKRHADVTT